MADRDEPSDGYTRALKAMDELLMKGTIQEGTKPKAGFNLSPSFRAHFKDLNHFRPAFNKRKKSVFKTINDTREQLGTKSTVVDAILGPPSKRIRAEEDVDDEAGVFGDGDCSEIVSGERTFKPLFTLWQWEDPDELESVVSVALVLPSGAQKYLLEVVDEGECLSFEVEWPPALADMEILHSKWMKAAESSTPSNRVELLKNYHPRIVMGKKSLKKKRDRANEKIRSVARIPLPMPVNPLIPDNDRHEMTFDDSPGAKVIYVDLKPAMKTSYNKEHKEGNFKNC